MRDEMLARLLDLNAKLAAEERLTELAEAGSAKPKGKRGTLVATEDDDGRPGIHVRQPARRERPARELQADALQRQVRYDRCPDPAVDLVHHRVESGL